MQRRVDGPAEISPFAYDDATFPVESFPDDSADIEIVTDADVRFHAFLANLVVWSGKFA